MAKVTHWLSSTYNLKVVKVTELYPQKHKGDIDIVVEQTALGNIRINLEL
jgi:hypothetical protein